MQGASGVLNPHLKNFHPPKMTQNDFSCHFESFWGGGSILLTHPVYTQSIGNSNYGMFFFRISRRSKSFHYLHQVEPPIKPPNVHSKMNDIFCRNSIKRRFNSAQYLKSPTTEEFSHSDSNLHNRKYFFFCNQSTLKKFKIRPAKLLVFSARSGMDL